MKHTIIFILSCIVLNIQLISQNITTGTSLAVNDIAVGPFLSLPSQFFTGINYTIKAKVINAGTSGQVNVPLKFSVNSTQAGTGSIPNLPAGAVDSVSFVWTPPTFGFFTIRIYSALVNDENRLNDTVTTTFYVLPAGAIGTQTILCRHGLNKFIPDNTPAGIYDTINVNIGDACFIYDVNVLIDTVTHTWVSDLIISIRHNAQTDTLLKNYGGSGDNFIGVMLNDSAGQSVPNPVPPGTYKPFRPLNIFNGYATNGGWILHITDVEAGDSGFLKAWCVQIVYQSCLGINTSNEVPRNYFLSRNYPNPFNPTTTINYGIPIAGNVTLKVYDILGREITTLVNNIKQPGTYTVDFDGTNLASGIYIYTLESGNFTGINKMVIIK